MWYVLQVRTGTEENIRAQCEKLLSESVLLDIFIPRYEEKRKVAGEWQTRTKILFPGYLFIDTDLPEELFLELWRVNGFARILETGGEFVPLTEKERSFLLQLGGKEHMVEISEGIIENSRLQITAGPLLGMEGIVRKVDRHKRKAWIEVEMFGRRQLLEIGLEIPVKTL